MNVSLTFLLGIGCINPPQPPPETRIGLNNNSTDIVPFDGNVTYACKFGRYFEEDFYMTHFNLTCQNDGNFTSPLPWHHCLNPEGNIVNTIISNIGQLFQVGFNVTERYCADPDPPHEIVGLNVNTLSME